MMEVSVSSCEQKKFSPKIFEHTILVLLFISFLSIEVARNAVSNRGLARSRLAGQPEHR